MRPYKHPNADELTLERIFHALSDPARLEIVRHLARVEAATCGELDGGRPKSSMSHHFKAMIDAGLLRVDVVGNVHLNNLRLDDLESRFPGLLFAVLQASQSTDQEATGLRKNGRSKQSKAKL